MKVGDLVELSAQGRRLKYHNDLRDKKGIIIDVQPKRLYPIFVQWFGYAVVDHQRSNLRYVSRS
jgi:hypothetical protein